MALGGCGVLSSGGDYPSYKSVDELFNAADLVVLASVGDSAETREINIGDGARVEYDVYRAAVETAYKGAPAEVIEVKQLPGQGHSLTPGARYVLFLEQYSEIPASLLNPSQAQYRVSSSGELAPIGDNNVQVTIEDLERLSSAD